MNLIERYAAEIGKKLPRRLRADIETEIRSTLEDMLEERAARAGRPADDEMVRELLKEYGAPDKVAQSYLPTQYLIGPKLFPIFWLVLKIVFTVLTVLAVIGFGVRYGMSDLTMQSFGGLLGKSILEYMGGMISAFGNLALIFALIERFVPQAAYDQELERDWNPNELTKEPDPDEIRPWEPIVTIAFTALGLVLFNFYPQILGIYFFSDEVSVFLPALSNAFFRMLPWINVTWMAGMGLQIWLLRKGRWTPPARWFEIALKVAGVVIAFLLLQGPPILALEAAQLVEAGMEQSAAGMLVSWVHQIVTISLAIVIVIGGFEVIKGVYDLLTRKSSRPFLNQ